MRRILISVGGTVLASAIAATAFAGAIDNKTNWSAEYIRTLNRNAATDFADIAAYNPAGTVKLHKGFTVNASAQYLAKDYKNVINDADFESDEGSFIPGIFAVYNTGKWSIFAAFSNFGGGGKVDFSGGNLTTVSIGGGISLLADRGTDALVQANGGNPAPVGTYYNNNLTMQTLEAESHYPGFSFGGAYNFNDIVSASLAIRYVDVSRSASGTITTSPTPTGLFVGAQDVTANVNYDQEDSGWGVVLGLNIAPSDALNIGIRYETETDLDLENDVNEDNLGLLPSIGIVDGQSVSRNLPSILALGASYRISPKLRTEVNLTYYFNENADWDGAEDLYDNGYDVGIALEYRFNDRLLGSIGYLYTELGADPENMLPENPELDANTLGAGIAYAFSEKLHGNFSIGNTFSRSDSFKPNQVTEVEYKKNIFFLALGVEHRF